MSNAHWADAYLTIPPGYGVGLGRLRWAHGCEAIERWNGTTLIFVEELSPLLEGVFAVRPVPPFAYVLSLIHRMRDGPNVDSAGFDRLWQAYTSARGAAGLTRNVGLLIVELCRDLTSAAGPPEWADVALALGRWRLFGEPDAPVEEPALTRAEFERRVEARLAQLDDATLLRWLTHGTGRAGAGDRLAEPVELLPVWVAKLVALARRRPRLVGAAALAPALDAALTIPLRRRSPDALPQGGYCDVTTRGEPDRLLPSQFALDPDEFVRRFAGRELLYFKREEPHTAEKPERVIIVDQGVRTWGAVRLALAAAALVLMKRDATRVGRVRFAATSAPGLIDVTGPGVDGIADHLEASDLTPHPGECLGRVTGDQNVTGGERDLILLTHPRALREPAVVRAANGRGPHDRLFVLSVDEQGRAELAEWTDTGPGTVRSFRVDLAVGEAARVAGDAPPGYPEASSGNWSGDVEPVGFPFRPGLISEPTVFGFDAEGDWLVIAGREGVLHGLAFDGSAPEILPRPFHDGVVLKQVDAVLGVTGGVVVCGRMKPVTGPSILSPVSAGVSTTIVVSGTPVVESSASWEHPPLPPAEVFVVTHYDRSGRRAAVHQLGPATGPGRWAVYPDLHCVVVRTASTTGEWLGCALDLATGDRSQGGKASGLGHRAAESWTRSLTEGSPPFSLTVLTSWPPTSPINDGPYLYLQECLAFIKRSRHPWKPIEPKRDGRSLFDGVTIHQAQLAGDVLALTLSSLARGALVLFRGPDGAVLSEITDYPPGSSFVLSPNGQRLARRRGLREFVVSETAYPAVALSVVTQAGLHNGLGIQLEGHPFRLTVRVGGFEHLFWLDQDEMHHALASGRNQTSRIEQRPAASPVPRYDTARFPLQGTVESGPWRAVLDRMGQVLLYATGPTPVAAFVVRRERAAVWGASGDVFWGDPALIGGPSTPDAQRVIARVIRTAGGRP